MQSNSDNIRLESPDPAPTSQRTSSAANFVPPNAANQASYNYSMVPPQFNHLHNPQAHYYGQQYFYMQQAHQPPPQPHWGVPANPSQFYPSGMTCSHTGNAAAPFMYWPSHQFGGVGVAPLPNNTSTYPDGSLPPSDTRARRHAAEQDPSSEQLSVIPNNSPSAPAASASSSVGRWDGIHDRTMESHSTPGLSSPAHGHSTSAVSDPSATSLATATFAMTAVAAAAPFVAPSNSYTEDNHGSDTVDATINNSTTTLSNTAAQVSENQSSSSGNQTIGQTNLKRALDENVTREESSARASSIRRRNKEQVAMLEHARGQLVTSQGLKAEEAVAARLPFQSRSGSATPPLPTSTATSTTSLPAGPDDHALSRGATVNCATTPAALSSRHGNSAGQLGVVGSSPSASKDKHRSTGLAPVSAEERSEARAVVEAVLVLWHNGGSSKLYGNRDSLAKGGGFLRTATYGSDGASAHGVVRSRRRRRRSTMEDSDSDDDDDDDDVVLAPWRALFFEEAVCRIPSTRFRFFPAQQVQAPGNGPARRLSGVRALAADAASLATSCAALPFRYGKYQAATPPNSTSSTGNGRTVASDTEATSAQKEEHGSAARLVGSSSSRGSNSIGDNAHISPTLVLHPELEGRAVVVRQRCSMPTPVDNTAATPAVDGRPPQKHEEELVLQCAWVVHTTNAIACGAAHEVSQRGMLRCTLRRAFSHRQVEPSASADVDNKACTEESSSDDTGSSSISSSYSSSNSNSDSSSSSHDGSTSTSPSKDTTMIAPPFPEAAVTSPTALSASMMQHHPAGPLKVVAMDVVFDPWYWTRALGEAFNLPAGLPLQPNTAAAALASTDASGSSSRRGHSGRGSRSAAASDHGTASSSGDSSNWDNSSRAGPPRSRRQQSAHAAACADAAAYTSMVRSELPNSRTPSSAPEPSSSVRAPTGAVSSRGGVLRLVCRTAPPFAIVGVCQDFQAAIAGATGVDRSSLIGETPPWLLAQDSCSKSNGQAPSLQKSVEDASHHDSDHEATLMTSGDAGEGAELESNLATTTPPSAWTEADCEAVTSSMLRVAASRRPSYCPQIPLNLGNSNSSGNSSSRAAGGNGTVNESAFFFAELFPLDDDDNGDKLERVEPTESKSSRSVSSGDLSIEKHPAPLVLWQLSQARPPTPETLLTAEDTYQVGGSVDDGNQGQTAATDPTDEATANPSAISTLYVPANDSTDSSVHGYDQVGAQGGRHRSMASSWGNTNTVDQGGGSALPPPRLSGGLRLGGSPLGTGTAGPPSVQPGNSSYRGPPPTQLRNPQWKPLSSPPPPLTPILRPYTSKAPAGPEESHIEGTAEVEPATERAEAARTESVAASDSAPPTASAGAIGPVWV